MAGETDQLAHEPKNRQELLELLREAHQNKLLDSEALAIVEGAIQVADLQVRDIMVPRSQMISIKATQTPRESSGRDRLGALALPGNR